jgi:alkylated DNA repair dioxygenase AlkB
VSENLLPKDGEAIYTPSLFERAEADALFEKLLREIEWRQEPIVIFGKRVMQPRLTAWYGEREYTYSGITLQPLPWSESLTTIRRRIGGDFNSVLLNLYRDQNDGMGWHADDEKELGRDPVIGSVSFGATREFQLRHRREKDLRVSIALEHGSYLLMRGSTQHHWMHALPKRRAPIGARINLTFRKL